MPTTPHGTLTSKRWKRPSEPRASTVRHHIEAADDAVVAAHLVQADAREEIAKPPAAAAAQEDQE